MSANLHSFTDLLKQDLSHLNELHALLVQERTSLEDNQLEVLNELQEKKKPLLLEIQQNARRRTDWVGQTKLSKPRFLKLLDEKAPPVMALYLQCEERLKEIKQLNDVNGQIIVRSQQRVVRLMQIIRGQSHQAQMYGKNGSTSAYGSKHTLAEA